MVHLNYVRKTYIQQNAAYFTMYIHYNEQPKAQTAASSDLIADMSDYKTNSEQYGNCMSKQMSGGAGVLNVANDRAYATPCDFCLDDT